VTPPAGIPPFIPRALHYNATLPGYSDFPDNRPRRHPTLSPLSTCWVRLKHCLQHRHACRLRVLCRLAAAVHAHFHATAAPGILGLRIPSPGRGLLAWRIRTDGNAPAALPATAARRRWWQRAAKKNGGWNEWFVRALCRASTKTTRRLLAVVFDPTLWTHSLSGCRFVYHQVTRARTARFCTREKGYHATMDRCHLTSPTTTTTSGMPTAVTTAPPPLCAGGGALPRRLQNTRASLVACAGA